MKTVLIIGDLHIPFTHKKYLDFCKKQYKKYKCNMVVFTGDIIDNHATSFHDHDPDGMSSGDELKASLNALKPWIKAFPVAKVCIGNHCRLPARQAFKAGVSTKWLRDYSDVLGCPNWDFKEQHIIDDVCYEHGEGSAPHLKMLRNRQSYVCGHIHSKLSITYSVSKKDRLFAMQMGWGGDQEAYSMEYAKNFPRGIVSCGVVLENGTVPIVIPMDM